MLIRENRNNLYLRNNLYPLYGNSFTLLNPEMGGDSGMLAVGSTSSPSLVLHNVNITDGTNKYL